MGRGSGDIKKIAEELKTILQKYNGIPSQTVDKAAYSKVKYYIKNHSDKHEIKELIEDYQLDQKKKRQLTQQVFEKRLFEITAILEKHQCFPKHDVKEYQAVYSFFKTNKERPEVRRLMFLYPYPESYAMVPDNQVRTVVYTKKVYIADEQSAYNYILYVYKQYKELPHAKTQPIMILKKAIRHLERGNKSSALISFLNEITALGCDDDVIREGYGMAQFTRSSYQDKVHQELIKNGACSIKYLSDSIIPGVHVSESFIYNLYSKEKTPIKVLGTFSKNTENYGNTILYVHYQEYELCDVDLIRNNAIKYYRDWKAFPPITIEDWKYWGCCNFFIDYKRHLDDGEDMVELLRKSPSVPQHHFENTIPYFTDSNFGYYKYIFFLVEKGFHLIKNNFTSRIQKTFDYNWKYDYNIREIEKLKTIFSDHGIL